MVKLDKILYAVLKNDSENLKTLPWTWILLLLESRENITAKIRGVDWMETLLTLCRLYKCWYVLRENCSGKPPFQTVCKSNISVHLCCQEENWISFQNTKWKPSVCRVSSNFSTMLMNLEIRTLISHWLLAE